MLGAVDAMHEAEGARPDEVWESAVALVKPQVEL
jgi:hypothetical protein